MQPKALLLIIILAPQSAVAFGDLDCIAIQSCIEGQCSPSTDPFAITFDWAGSAAVVEVDDLSTTFPLASAPIATDLDDESDLPDTDLEFGDIAKGGAGLLVIAESPDNIVAYFAQDTQPMTLRTGFCDIREAA